MINLTFIRDQHFYVVEPGSQVWARVNYYLANQGNPFGVFSNVSLALFTDGIGRTKIPTDCTLLCNRKGLPTGGSRSSNLLWFSGPNLNKI
jgi:hypothetical protein